MDSEKLKKTLSKNLIHFRKLSRLTQSELAEKINYSDKSVSKWERAEGTPDILVLSELAELYGITVNDFLDENAKEKKSKLPLSNRQRTFITILSAGLVWLVATVVFVLLSIILGFVGADFRSKWIVFIYAVPIMSIVTLILSNIWKNTPASYISSTLLIWGVTVSIHLSIIVFVLNTPVMSLIYLVAGVLQVLLTLWYLMKHLKNKRI